MDHQEDEEEEEVEELLQENKPILFLPLSFSLKY